MVVRILLSVVPSSFVVKSCHRLTSKDLQSIVITRGRLCHEYLELWPLLLLVEVLIREGKIKQDAVICDTTGSVALKL